MIYGRYEKGEETARFHFADEFIIGSGPDCDLVLRDEYASTKHVRVYPANGSWYADDLGSTNGTWIDGSRVYETSLLRKGSKLRIGRTIISVVPE